MDIDTHISSSGEDSEITLTQSDLVDMNETLKETANAVDSNKTLEHQQDIMEGRPQEDQKLNSAQDDSKDNTCKMDNRAMDNSGNELNSIQENGEIYQLADLGKLQLTEKESKMLEHFEEDETVTESSERSKNEVKKTGMDTQGDILGLTQHAKNSGEQ